MRSHSHVARRHWHTHRQQGYNATRCPTVAHFVRAATYPDRWQPPVPFLTVSNRRHTAPHLFWHSIYLVLYLFYSNLHTARDYYARIRATGDREEKYMRIGVPLEKQAKGR